MWRPEPDVVVDVIVADAASTSAVLSLPNFYGAHGYDPRLRDVSAIFYAAGPDICRDHVGTVHNIDIAPTVLKILNVPPADTVQGRAIRLCGERDDDRRDDRNDDREEREHNFVGRDRD